MADWQRKINMNPELTKWQDGEITVQELAVAMARKVRAIADFKDHDDLNDERDELAAEFEGMADDPSLTTSDFDDVMQRLLDWGDTKLDNKWNGKKVCWIDSIAA
jgi:hypothetical protein